MAKGPKRKKKSAAIRDSEFRKRSLAAKRSWQTRKAKKKARSESAKKGWATRRARSSLARPEKQKTGVQKKVDRLESKLGKREKKRQEEFSEESKRTKREILLENRRLRERLAETEKRLFTEKHIKKYLSRFTHLTMLDSLPAQRVNEKRDEWAYRIVRAITKEGVYSREQAYRVIARHTGSNISEIYSMFVYVGMGEMVA